MIANQFGDTLAAIRLSAVLNEPDKVIERRKVSTCLSTFSYQLRELERMMEWHEAYDSSKHAEEFRDTMCNMMFLTALKLGDTLQISKKVRNLMRNVAIARARELLSRHFSCNNEEFCHKLNQYGDELGRQLKYDPKTSETIFRLYSHELVFAKFKHDVMVEFGYDPEDGDIKSPLPKYFWPKEHGGTYSYVKWKDVDEIVTV